MRIILPNLKAVEYNDTWRTSEGLARAISLIQPDTDILVSDFDRIDYLVKKFPDGPEATLTTIPCDLVQEELSQDVTVRVEGKPVTIPAGRKYVIVLYGSDTPPPAGTYRHELWVKLAGGLERVYFAGVLTVPRGNLP